jgi:hypothetical protein
MNQKTRGFLCVILCGIFSTTSLSAAQIAGTFSAQISNSAVAYDLTALGTSDWAYWNKADLLTVATLAPTNEKAGASLISAVSPVGGIAVRGTNSATKPPVDFSFTDGTSPTSGTQTDPTAVFNSTLGTASIGTSFSVTLPTVSTYRILIWAGGFASTGATAKTRLSATLGAASYSSPGETIIPGTPKPTFLYTLTVTSDTANQVVTISHILAELSGTTTNAHALIAASAVSLDTAPPADSDGDGLTDLQEQVLGLDPQVSNAALIAAIKSHPDYFDLFDDAGISALTQGGVILPQVGSEVVNFTIEVQRSTNLTGWFGLQTYNRNALLPEGKNFLRLTIETLP